MASRDLTTLATVKAYLGISDSSSDTLLIRLVTAMSTAFVQEVGREILRKSYTETFDGDGSTFYVLENLPVIGDPTVTIDGTVVVKRATVTDTGWVLLDYGSLELVGSCFSWGTANVVLAYEAGQFIPSESATIPGSPFQVTAGQPLGRFFSDIGVTFSATGAALTKVASTPAASQYSVDTVGVYTFNTADAAKGVLLSYAHIPSDVEDCVVEMVAFKFRKRERIDQVSANVGGQSVFFTREAWPVTIQAVFDRWQVPTV